MIEDEWVFYGTPREHLLRTSTSGCLPQKRMEMTRKSHSFDRLVIRKQILDIGNILSYRMDQQRTDYSENIDSCSISCSSSMAQVKVPQKGRIVKIDSPINHTQMRLFGDQVRIVGNK